MSKMNKLIEIDNISVGYDNKPDVLKNVSLNVYENDFLGIIGPNGGGKTSLLKAILGLVRTTNGAIRFYENGKPVRSINIGYLPQLNRIDKKFPISVHDVILSGLTPKKRWIKRYGPEDKVKVLHIAEKLGIRDLLPHPIGELSGGQLQRVLLGRAVVDTPRIVVLDEPNTYVDKRFETNFYKLLAEINKNIAIILVSHDVGTIVPMVKNIACVNQTLHYHPANEITEEWLESASLGCPIEILGHGTLPHRVLRRHDEHCKEQ